MIIETVFTAIFIIVILTVTKKTPSQAAFAIALTLVVIHFAIVPFTGASVNPARSIASAVIGQKDLGAALDLHRRSDRRRGDRLGDLPVRQRGRGRCLTPDRLPASSADPARPTSCARSA